MDTSRNTFWDIVKGIAIMCVILGHSCRYISVVAVVYLFHLPVFFFVSGYLYNKNKWSRKPGEFIGTRFMSVWPRYMVYTVIFVLIHNILVKCGILEGSALYNNTAIVSAIINGSVFAQFEIFASALWFIPVWLFGLFIFELIVCIFKEDLLIAIVSAVVSVLGIILAVKDVNLMFHLQTSLIAVGFICMGYLLRRSGLDIEKNAKWWIGLIALALLLVFNRVFGILIDLSNNSTRSGAIYITGAVGIIFVLCLANLINKIKYVKNAFAIFGRYSFDIMALHFAVIKLIDLIYVAIYPKCINNLAAFPSSFAASCDWLYLIAGLIIPSLVGFLLDKIKLRV